MGATSGYVEASTTTGASGGSGYTYNTPPKPCPTCGTCPTCGAHTPRPYWQYPNTPLYPVVYC